MVGGAGRGETRLGMHVVQGCKSFQISRVGCTKLMPFLPPHHELSEVQEEVRIGMQLIWLHIPCWTKWSSGCISPTTCGPNGLEQSPTWREQGSPVNLNGMKRLNKHNKQVGTFLWIVWCGLFSALMLRHVQAKGGK